MSVSYASIDDAIDAAIHEGRGRGWYGFFIVKFASDRFVYTPVMAEPIYVGGDRIDAKGLDTMTHYVLIPDAWWR